MAGQQTDISCNGTLFGPYVVGSGIFWNSDNVNVVTADGGYLVATGTGTATISATWETCLVWIEEGHCSLVCDQTTENASVAVIPTVTITKADGSQLPSPFRIGINGGGNDRKQSLKATVSPTSQTANVNILVSNKVTLTNVQKNTGTGVITFDVVGNTASAAGSTCSTGDSFITAEFSNGTLFATLLEKPVFVAVPSKVATPHDTTGSLVIANRVLDASTSPAVHGLPANHVLLATIFVRFLTITVKDQCDNLIGDLYVGARVTETHGTTMEDINQPLTASSTYSDPVGVSNDGAVVERGSTAAAGWPNWPLLPMPESDVTQNVAVQVDGFALAPAITGRRVVTTPSTNTVTITWPN